MPYKLTQEQQDILDTAISMYSNPSSGDLLKISAVAGSSKTFTLTKIAEALPHTSQLYLAYNKSIAEEAKAAFPSWVQCKTTHSLAYGPIITHGLNLNGEIGRKRDITPRFSYRDVYEKIDYDYKVIIAASLEEFFLSKYTHLDGYLDSGYYEQGLRDLIHKYFMLMVDSKIPCTHSFYLKMFHILLSKNLITYSEPYDLLMLDEAGDLNPVTLEIFQLLPAKVKIMAGDQYQNIYSFNHTINGFKELEGKGTMKTLSTSFRCSKELANDVENFCISYIDDKFIFNGIDHADTAVRNEAVISRTNSGLIEYMIKFTQANIGFNLVREPREIFADMLTLMNLSKDEKIRNNKLKFLQQDVDSYFNSKTAQEKYKTCLMYIKALHEEEDYSIKIAIQTILKYNASNIYKAYAFAKSCDENKTYYPVTLTTAHSSKGLTFDKVTLANDFDLSKILLKGKSDRTPEEQEELRLYYVACTRARLELDNAKYLDIN